MPTFSRSFGLLLAARSCLGGPLVSQFCASAAGARQKARNRSDAATRRRGDAAIRDVCPSHLRFLLLKPLIILSLAVSPRHLSPSPSAFHRLACDRFAPVAVCRVPGSRKRA